MDIETIGRKIDKIDTTLTQHIIESEAVRAQVNEHERLLRGGCLDDIKNKVDEIKTRVIIIEERIAGRRSTWKDIAFGVGLISTLLGVIYTIVRLR